MLPARQNHSAARDEANFRLKATADAIGRQDISGQVKRVFDIMLRNHLRNQEADFASLTSMRGSRVDARGIQVQGELDADGQMTLSVFNRAKSLKSNSPDAQGQDCRSSVIMSLCGRTSLLCRGRGQVALYF